MNTIKSREISLPLGIVVEKRKSAHPWADWQWIPVAVFLADATAVRWKELMQDDDLTRYHAATLLLTLHRKETEALRLNLMLDQPELYVVLEEAADPASEFPYEPHVVTASSYDAQDFSDAGDYLMEKVAMPEAVAVLIQAFVEEHHVDEKFIKRRRDKLKIDDHNFGKQPIYTSHTKH